MFGQFGTTVVASNPSPLPFPRLPRLSDKAKSILDSIPSGLIEGGDGLPAALLELATWAFVQRKQYVPPMLVDRLKLLEDVVARQNLAELEQEVLRCAESGDAKRLAEILELGVSPSQTTTLKMQSMQFGGCTRTDALGVAAHAGHVDVCKVLLEHGADPRYRFEGHFIGPRALPLAAASCHWQICKLLHDAGALVERDGGRELDESGSLYHVATFASSMDQRETAKLLLEYGARVDCVHPRWGLSPLMEAAARGDLELCKLLLERGADISLAVPRQETSGFATGYEEGQTSLHRAVAAPHWNPNASQRTDEVLALLLEHGANPLAKTTSGVTPLELAGASNLPAALRIIGAAVLSYSPTGRGDDAEHRAAVAEALSRSLAAACAKNSPAAVDALLDIGATVTPDAIKAALSVVVHGAGEVRDPACLQRLFERGGEAAVVAMNTIPNLFLQTLSNPCMKLLIDRGADVHQKVNGTDMNALEWFQTCKCRELKNFSALKKAVASQPPAKQARKK